MSLETLTWLNTNTLIGHTDKRGKAWHYRKAEQGEQTNHYPGAIPVSEVERRLFNWQAIPVEMTFKMPATLETADGIDEHGAPYRNVQITDKRAWVRNDNADLLGIFSLSYEGHQYREWLLGGISNLLGDSLGIGSAGLLKRGGVAWVSVETPDTITTKHGFAFRPHVMACTSFDGSLATTYKPITTAVVCDNTMTGALGEEGPVVKVKHSKYSKLKIEEARDALGLIHRIAEDFEAEVDKLCETTVTDKQWAAFLDAHSPIPTDKGKSRTMALNQQETLRRLWLRDERVQPWANTAWGVVQAVNTYVHHEGIVRGASRPERNMLRAVTGDVDKLDGATLDTLNKILSNV